MEIILNKKRYLFWSFVSYIFLFSFLYAFIIIPQKNKITKMKTEKELIEYNYLKLKNSPKFFNEIKSTINIANDKIKNFEWLNYGDDPNLLLYEYIDGIATKNGLEIIELKRDEKNDEIYYRWNLKLRGDYGKLVYFIYNVEKGEKYLKIEEIEVVPGEENNNFFNLKIAGIKKVK